MPGVNGDETRVLLIEDNPGDARLIEEALRDAPVSLIHAGTLRSGLEQLGRAPVQIVLLDLSLPDADGLEALQLIRAAHPALPVVVVTGLDDEDAAQSALEEGAWDYLVKGEVSGRLMRRLVRYSVERAQVLERLRESEERYAVALRGANDGLWDWNLQSGRLHLSPRWKAMLGYAEDELEDEARSWFDRVLPEDLPGLQEAISRHLAGETPHLEHEQRVRHRSGEVLWMLTRGIAVRDRRGRAYRLAGSQTDVTRRKRVEERLRHEALHDELTDLPNRAYFTELLDRAVARARRRRRYAFAVLFLDLDRFKIVNDSLGHAAGDQLLVEAARRLRRCVRPEDTVSRLGGDEFTVLLDGIHGAEDAVRVATRIRAELSAPYVLGGHDVYTSVSIGIALGDGSARAEDLIRDADLAMYRAKSGGKDRYELFDARMHAAALDRLRLESDLRRALERSELVLHYQPIVDLERVEITGFEALIRWQHPERGLLAPDDFVPLAEENGLILPIGRWVLDEACHQLQVWRQARPERNLTISVNLSTRQFDAEEPLLAVREALDRTGLEPSALRLEITESVMLRDADAALVTLGGLHALQVRLELDDFGTGMSSLSYLHRFPIDALKIDRSFVAGLGSNGTGAIVRGVVGLAACLKKDVVAEGIETVAQLRVLRRLGCRRGQGFLFSRPLPVEQAEALLDRGLPRNAA